MAKNLYQYPHLARIHQEINTMFERLMESPPGVGMDMWDLPVDVFQKGEALHVRADVPGLDKKDIAVLVRGNTLIIKGQKRPTRYPKDSVMCFHCMEITHGRFEKFVRLDHSVDVRNIKARLKDGVLSIRLPIVKDRRGSELVIAIESE